MKNLLLFILFISISFAEDYSWEDGGTILGSYGNLVDAENVGPTDGVTPYDGDYMLTVSESPIDGTPQAFLGWVTDIEDGDEITACFYGYDDTPGGSPSMRIWGSWTDNDDINAYAGTAGGNDYGGDEENGYTAGTGWDQVCHTFSTDFIYNGEQTWDSGEGLVIQARLYSSSSGPDPTKYFIDLISVETDSQTATIHFPSPLEGLIADAGDDQTVDAGATVTLDGSGSINTDGDIDEWYWEQTSGIAVVLDDEEAETTSFTAPSETTTLSFDLTVYDEDGNESSDSVSITVLASAGDLSISDIQGESDSSPYVGQVVTTDGYVTAVAENGFFIQDAADSWSGIWILDFGDAAVERGDEVELTGTVVEYYDLTEIDIATSGSYEVISTGNTIYNPINITESEESFESVLVTVSGVCDGPPNEYGDWILSGDNDIMIDNLMYEFIPTTGQEYTITGPLYYAYGDYKVEPRDANDVQEGILSNSILIENFSILEAYPNPFNPVISIDFSVEKSEVVEISVYDLMGQKVDVLFNKFCQAHTLNKLNWDASNYSSGDYFIQLETNNFTKTHKVTLIK